MGRQPAGTVNTRVSRFRQIGISSFCSGVHERKPSQLHLWLRFASSGSWWWWALFDGYALLPFSRILPWDRFSHRACSFGVLRVVSQSLSFTFEPRIRISANVWMIAPSLIQPWDKTTVHVG